MKHESFISNFLNLENASEKVSQAKKSGKKTVRKRSLFLEICFFYMVQFISDVKKNI